MPSSAAGQYVPEEALFTNAGGSVNIVGLDIDNESPLIIDRCLSHVRSRIQQQQHNSTSQQQTMAAHLDDVAACRERVWQHIYHPRAKQNVPSIINVDLSSGSVVAAAVGPSTAANSEADAEVRTTLASTAGAAPPQQNAYDALRRMEEAQRRAQLASADDVARRSMGTSTRGEGAGGGGDVVADVVTHNVMHSVVGANVGTSSSISESETVDEANEEAKMLKTIQKEAAEKAAKAKALREARLQQSQKDTLLALFDAVRPDPLLGAVPLPADHCGNAPFASKRATNMLLLKFLGLAYPGGKSELRRELPFSIDKNTSLVRRTMVGASSSNNKPSQPQPQKNGNNSNGKPTGGTSSLFAQDTSGALGRVVDKQLSGGGRSLVLYEDRRRRAFLSAIATQLGGGNFSPSSAADFVTAASAGSSSSDEALFNVALRIGAGANSTSSSSSSSSSLSSADAAAAAADVNQQKIRTLQALYHLNGNTNAAFATALLAAAQPARPALATAVEYAIACLTASPFNAAHYPIKLFGYVQPTAIGSHSACPLTRFNVFELEHLPTPTDKLRANVRRIRALRAAERSNQNQIQPDDTKKKTVRDAADNAEASQQGPPSSGGRKFTAAIASAAASSGRDTEQLMLKKWSLSGAVYPSMGAYHLKGLWSANAKLSLLEAHKALGVDATAAPDTSSAAGGDNNNNKKSANIKASIDGDVAESADVTAFDESVVFANDEEASAKVLKSRYRADAATKREQGLVGATFDKDRIRAISLLPSTTNTSAAVATTAAVSPSQQSPSSPADLSTKDAAGLIAEAQRTTVASSPSAFGEGSAVISNAHSPATTDAAANATSSGVKNGGKRNGGGRPPAESVVRPLRAGDREVVGIFEDAEAAVSWRRFWDPRWSVEAYARHVRSTPTDAEQDEALVRAHAASAAAQRARVSDDGSNGNGGADTPSTTAYYRLASPSGAGLTGEDDGALCPSSVAPLVGPTATVLGVRVRADHNGRLFNSGVGSFFDGFFAPLSTFTCSGSNASLLSPHTTALRGWAASLWNASAFVDPIQRHGGLKAQIDLVRLTPLPWWRGTDAIEGRLPSPSDDEGTVSLQPSEAVRRTTLSSLIPKAYGRARELLSFDLRVRIAAEAKYLPPEAPIATFVTEGDSRQYSEPTIIPNATGGVSDSTFSSSPAAAAAVPQSVANLRKYVRSVRLPQQSSVHTVRGVHGTEDYSGGGTYSTERLAGNWFVTSTVELSKPISFINCGSSPTSTSSSSSTSATAASPPPLPPLRFLLFWNGLWAANSANNKESIGYAVRREPHASRRELKGTWHTQYLPTSLECAWSSVWSRSQQTFTSEPSPADLPAGSTFFKFMKCGAVWDI